MEILTVKGSNDALKRRSNGRCILGLPSIENDVVSQYASIVSRGSSVPYR